MLFIGVQAKHGPAVFAARENKPSSFALSKTWWNAHIPQVKLKSLEPVDQH